MGACRVYHCCSNFEMYTWRVFIGHKETTYTPQTKFGVKILVHPRTSSRSPAPAPYFLVIHRRLRCLHPKLMEKSQAIPSAADVFIDPPPSYKLLLKCPSGLSPSQVSVDFSPSNDRTPHPDVDLEKSISEIWDRRIQENPALFNGTKFRYGGNVMHAVGDSNQESHVCLHLGLTDYRTFMGTNLSTSWEKFLVPSEDDSVRCQHTSSPLGNGAVVETADKKIVVLQRSNNVGEFPGFFVFPGGHPEPKEIGILAHQDDPNLSASGHINKMVSQEMFNSIIREVVEEIGVPASSLVKFHDSRSPAFIGISRREFNVRPSAFFFIKCSLRSEEIQQLYSSAEDGYESTQLFTVARSELEKIAIKMPGCHWGGLALYKLMLETAKDM